MSDVSMVSLTTTMIRDLSNINLKYYWPNKDLIATSAYLDTVTERVKV